MKTWVQAKHGGDCPNADQNNGVCPGAIKADELNKLGADEEPFMGGGKYVNGRQVTNGDVRQNWLSMFDHLEISHVEQ